MLGGACDEQLLDVYRRSHDRPEGGGRGARLRDAGRRPWGCRARRRRLGRWTVGGHRDQGRQAGDRFDERVPHDPLTVYVFSTPVLCAPSGALSFGLPGRAARTVPQCGTRDTLGKNFRTAISAPLIRQTGTPGARACAAPRPREAERQSGASARPAAALGARDRARTSTRRAARPRLRPRASSGSRMLATVSSAGAPLPSPARSPGSAPRSALRAQQRRVARRAQARRARRRASAPASHPTSERALPLKSAATSLLKPARPAPLKLAPRSLPKLARASLPKLARVSLPKLARASLLKLARASLLKLAPASLLKLASGPPPASAPEPAPWPSPRSLLTLALLPLAISRLRSHRGLVVRSLSGRARAAGLPVLVVASSVGPRALWPLCAPKLRPPARPA